MNLLKNMVIKLDINSLGVFNSMHNLGITESEFADIEREQNEGNTGLYIATIKKGYSICVSNDENHQIIIKKIKDNKVCPQSRILFKTLTTLKDLPKEIYILHSIAQYRALDSTIKYVTNNLEELKDRICDRFVDEYPKQLGEAFWYDSYDYNNLREEKKEKKESLISKQLEALFWLFGEDYKKFQKEVKFARFNVPRIIKVFQRNNRRVAIIQEEMDYEQRRGYFGTWAEHIKGTTFKVRTYTPRNRCFNYCSPNRELYIKYDKEIWLDDDLFEKVSPEELKVLYNRINFDDWLLLTADEFNEKQPTIRIEMMSEKRKARDEKAKTNLCNNIEKQFKSGKVVRNGITITKKGMEYEGIVFKGEKFGEYVVDEQIHLQTNPEFNKIVEGYICWVLNISVKYDYYSRGGSVKGYDCEFKGKEKIQIKDIKITIESRKNNIFVNDCRIVKNDVKDVLVEAIKYQQAQEYNKWVRYTSTVNLKLQKTLKEGGLTFNLKIDTTDDNELPTYDGKMLLTIPIRREKGKTYATIKGKEYKVKNHNALFDIAKEIDSCRIGCGGGGYLQRTIKLLYRALEGITYKEIGDMITGGRKEFKVMQLRIKKENAEKTNKSKEFLKNAVKLSKAVKIKGGYKVNGESGTIYTIDTDNCGVNKIENGEKKYLCIVDNIYNDKFEWEKNDKIARRLLMLSKDIKVANEIYNNGDKMDKWWLELTHQEEKWN